MPHDATPDLVRLKWQCRRGMLELDLLLERFVDEKYAALNDDEQADFVQLLEQSDQILYEWFTGNQIPYEVKYRDLVNQIRQ